MKKLVVITLFTLSSSLFTLCGAQSFQAGSLIAYGSFGLDILHTSYTQTIQYLGANVGKTQTNTGGAATSTPQLGAEFGVTNWLGLGLAGQFDEYIHGKNDTNSGVSSALAFEIGAIINFHIIRHTHFDLLAGFNIGYSNLTITSNNGTNDQIYGSGTWFDVHLTTRIYVGKFGFNITLVFPNMNYPKLTSNVTTYNEYVLSSFKLSGTGFNAGVQYHFLR